jgi:hypothetical protein
MIVLMWSVLWQKYPVLIHIDPSPFSSMLPSIEINPPQFARLAKSAGGEPSLADPMNALPPELLLLMFERLSTRELTLVDPPSCSPQFRDERF